MIHDARIIPPTAAHPPAVVRSWSDIHARWEATLVVGDELQRQGRVSGTDEQLHPGTVPA
jgi:hypothetical protein